MKRQQALTLQRVLEDEKTRSQNYIRYRPRVLFCAVAILIAAIAVINLVNLNPSLGWGGDSAMYIMNAINIADGNPYNATRYIQNPYSFLGPPAYPPGFPMLLAPVYAVFGLDIQALNTFMVCLFAITLAVIAYCFSDEFRVPHGGVCLLVLIALTGLNTAVVEYAAKPLSDIPCLLFVFLSLVALKTVYARIELSKPVFSACLVAGSLVYFAISTRIVGVALLPAIVVYDLTRYRRLTRASLVSIPVCLALLGVQQVLVNMANVPIEGAGVGYGGMMQHDLLGRLSRLPTESLQNLVFYAKALHAFWLSNENKLWVTPFLYVTLLLALVGYGYRLATRYTIVELFPVLYIAALLPWSAHSWRYLIPAIPFYFFYVLIGLLQLQRLLTTRYPVLLAAFLLIACVPYTNRYATALPDHAGIDPTAPNSPAAFALYRYIDTHTDPDAVIIFRKPRILTLYTNRYASTFTYAQRPELTTDRAHLRYFRRVNAEYALAGPPDHDHTIDKLAQRHPEQFHLVYTSGPFRLYGFEPKSVFMIPTAPRSGLKSRHPALQLAHVARLHRTRCALSYEKIAAGAASWGS